ncbi:MAG: agarase [Tepidisphaeraceae bacterium]
MPKRTLFGGVKSYPRQTATGFFRTQLIDGRWWLVDPQGYRIIDAGVTSTNLGSQSPEAAAALKKKFGTPEGWAAQTRKLLLDAGFDGTGNWSNDELLRKGADRPLVYTHAAPFMAEYGARHGGTTEEVGHKGYPNRCIFVFDPQFAESADRTAATLSRFKDDPYLLGYFTDNELPFPLDSLDRYLTLPDADPGRQAAEAFLTANHVERQKLTDDVRQQWTAVAAEKYFSIVHDAIRKYDPNHLILGPRFHATDYRNPALLRTAAKYIDVVGYNSYGVWSSANGFVDRIYRDAGLPLLVSEFYAKAEDSGLANTDGAGWVVKTQADRASFYENYTLGLIESRVCVGWQWFRYMDNDPAVSRGPNPNDSNKGIVSRYFEPYATLLDTMKRVNDARYALADYFDARTKP